MLVALMKRVNDELQQLMFVNRLFTTPTDFIVMLQGLERSPI